MGHDPNQRGYIRGFNSSTGQWRGWRHATTGPFGVQIFIEGDDVIEKAFKELPNRIFNQVMKAAMAAAVIPIVDTAKSLCPVESGLLKESLGYHIKSYKRSGMMTAVVGPQAGNARYVKVRGLFGEKLEFRKPTKYAHLVEFGTRSHAIGDKDLLYRLNNPNKYAKERQTGRIVTGARPRAFLRPAYDEHKEKSIRRMRSAIFDGVHLWWDKLNKQAARKRKIA